VAVLVVKMVVILLVVDLPLDLVEDLGVVVEHRIQDLLDNQGQTHPGMDLLIMEMLAVADQVHLSMLLVAVVVPVVPVNLTPVLANLEMVEMEEQVPLHMDHPSQ
tara:strand:+ start:193 stop:507 length:315 start_codon:yes stop_codon:yes gene_type:complete